MKKRILAITIVVIMMLSLVACAEKTHQVGDLSIELPATFIDAGTLLSAVVSEDKLSTAGVTVKPYFSPVDGIAVAIAEEELDDYDYEDDSIFDFDDTEDIIVVNGRPAYEFSEDMEGQSIKGFAVYYSSEDNYYVVVFACSGEEYENKKEKMIEYAATIEVD